MARSPKSIRPLLTAAAVAVAIALPSASSAAVPVGLYPLQSEGLTDGERSEVQAVVESALLGAERRGVLEPRSPLILPAACRAPITVGCVATLAKGGVVLYAKAKRRGAQILVTVLFVDAIGRKTRATAFPVDLFIQNLRPANDAIASVEADLVAGALEDPTPVPAPRPPAERPKVAAPPPAPPPAERPEVAQPAPVAQPAEPQVAPPPSEPPPARAEPAPAPAEPPAASVPIDLAATVKPPPEPPRATRTSPRPQDKGPATERSGDWRGVAARWCAGGGAAMLVAGGVVGLTGKRLADALSDRYERGVLRPGDAALYDRVDRYERIANALLVTGGVASAAGIGFFILAPTPGGATVAIAGSF